MFIVTGAAGFIGSNLVAGLNAAGHDRLVLVDWLESGPKWQNLASARYEDLIFPEALPAFLDRHGCDVRGVFHLGANSSTTSTDGDAIVRTNLHPSMLLWRWCSAHGKPLIYASSAATYGNGAFGFDDQLPARALEVLRPLNLYGWSKHTFDIWALQQMARGHAPPHWAGLKFFNVYGPQEAHKGEMMSVMTKALPLLKRGDPISLFKSHHPEYRDGEQLRDFVYVKDCVDVMMWMMHRAEVATLPLGGIFNLGTGEPRAFRHLIEAAAAALNTTARIHYVDMPIEIRDKYQYYTRGNIDKLRQLGYNADFHTLETGAQHYVARLGDAATQ